MQSATSHQRATNGIHAANGHDGRQRQVVGGQARTREAAWSTDAFLEHRQRAPHIAHPTLCCRDRDKTDYACLLCWQLLNRPVLLNNGDASTGSCGDGPYCDQCIREHLCRTPWCPDCKRPTLVDQLIDDAGMERAMRGVVVKCAYFLEGCGWTGEVRDFESHQRSCQHKPAG